MGNAPTSGLALMLMVTLSACATPQDRLVAEADRTWRCAMTRDLPRGRIEASVTLTRAGAQQEAIRFVWRREMTTSSSIQVAWYGTDGAAPYASAPARLSFPIGPRYNGQRRLELRRAAPDGSVGEIAFASSFVRMPRRVYARWGDVLAAARDGAFFAVAADPGGGMHAQTRVEADLVAEPGRAAATLQAQMKAMIADHERSCRLSSKREELIIIT